jgi:hypothetical protein
VPLRPHRLHRGMDVVPPPVGESTDHHGSPHLALLF